MNLSETCRIPVVTMVVLAIAKITAVVIVKGLVLMLALMVVEAIVRDRLFKSISFYQ